MALGQRYGVQAEYPIQKRIPVRPMGGVVKCFDATVLPMEASPEMQNFMIKDGIMQKRRGYRAFKNAVKPFSTSVTGLFSTREETGTVHLYATSKTGVKKFNFGTVAWDACTGPALTGSDDDLFSFEVSQNSIVFSQGVDQVQRIPFNTVYAILNANAVPAKFITRAASRLFLGNTVEAGVPKPFRLRRSVALDHTDWVGIGSGFVDIDEFPYFVQNLKKLGTRIAAYTDGAIWLGTRTGQVESPVLFEPVASECGLYAARTLKGRKDVHYYLGNDDFYSFDGVGQPKGIAQKVFCTVLEDLNPNKTQRFISEVMTDVGEYISFLCSRGAPTPDHAWIYNWLFDSWYKWTVSGVAVTVSHRQDSTASFDDLMGTFGSLTGTFDTLSIDAARPILLTGHTDGQVYEWGDSFKGDNGAAILCSWSSRDFRATDLHPDYVGKQIVLRDVEVDYVAGVTYTLDFYFSVDAGGTWDGPYQVECTGGTGIKQAAVHRQVTGERIRWKVMQQSATMECKIVEFRPNFELHEAM